MICLALAPIPVPQPRRVYMASFIATKRKSECKAECAYFDTVRVLADSEVGTEGQDRFVCLNKRLDGPASCKGCPFFSKSLPLDDQVARQTIVANPLLQELETAMLDMEAAEAVKRDADRLYERRRRRVQHIVDGRRDKSGAIVEPGLGVKKVTLGNRKVTIASRTTDEWLKDALRAKLIELGEKVKLPIVDRVFKKRLALSVADPEVMAKLVDFIAQLNAEGAGIEISSSETVDEEALKAFLAAGVMKRADLAGTYRTKTSRWPLVRSVVRKSEPERMIFI